MPHALFRTQANGVTLTWAIIVDFLRFKHIID
jgi:hypothetical protein